ncbi:collagen alpha-2(I) chain-like [Choloepus didactylus]|uniref:collagen alpha-2(I) chain-like n=1 Tax=Choloepus didactylus TaxID=27675 RepID=UPI00189DB613|nr:collagen alpha-2(I) chain-like [Choloepus didactylus]
MAWPRLRDAALLGNRYLDLVQSRLPAGGPGERQRAREGERKGGREGGREERRAGGGSGGRGFPPLMGGGCPASVALGNRGAGDEGASRGGAGPSSRDRVFRVSAPGHRRERSGVSTPRPAGMTSESFASRCLYLPGPAGTLPRLGHGQRVGPQTTSSSCERGALPDDLRRLRPDCHEWRSGKAQKLRPARPTGDPRGDPGRGRNHGLPTAPRCLGFGGKMGAPHLLLQGRVVNMVGCALGAPQPLPANPTSHTPSSNTTTQKKLDTF